MNEGHAEVEVAAPGYQPSHRLVTIEGNETHRLSVSLSPIVPPVKPPAPTPAVSRVTAVTAAPLPVATPVKAVTAAAPPALVTSALSPTADTGRPWRRAGAIAGGIGIAGIAAGIWMSVRVESLERDAERFPEDEKTLSAGRRAQTLQWVGYGVGAAGVVGGCVLYFLGPRWAGAPGSMSAAAAPVAGGVVGVATWPLWFIL